MRNVFLSIRVKGRDTGKPQWGQLEIHVMAQVGTFNTAFSEGLVIVALGDPAQIAIYVIAIIGLAAIVYGSKKRFAR